METTKFLVCGSIREEPEAKLLISRTRKAQEKQGPFSFILCCGFNPNENKILLAAEQTWKELPLDIYLGSEQKTENAASAESVDGRIHSAEPFEIVQMSDFRVSFIPVGRSQDWNAFSNLVETCVHSQVQLDIAILDCSLDRQSLLFPENCSSLSKGLAKLKPRYIFCSVEPFEYFEYGPFLFEDSIAPSRFINLANVGSNQKWLYALSLRPLAHMKESDCTNELATQTLLSNPFVLDGLSGKERNAVESRLVETPKSKQVSCWFCLANEKDLHLIIDVGQHCFLALAKGYLVKYHVLIVPIEHVGSRFELSEEAWKEVQFYLALLESWWRSLNLQIFWFERHMKPPSGSDLNHMQIQVIGMPIKEDPSLVSNLLDRESKKLGVTIWELETEKELEDKYHVDRTMEYILFKLPDNCYALHIVEKNSKKRKTAGEQSPYFALFSFGRKIAALAMGMPQKVDWKKSINDEKEEERVTNELRQDFLLWKRKNSN